MRKKVIFFKKMQLTYNVKGDCVISLACNKVEAQSCATCPTFGVSWHAVGEMKIYL